VQRGSDLKLFFVVLCLTVVVLSVFGSFEAFAASDSLTDLFATKSFRGSGEALEKMDVLGMVLHYIISWFSFLGLCLVLYQKFVTLLYLSSRNTFDTIYDIKMNKMKGGLAGFKGLFDVVKSGEGPSGGGFDVFITFVYGLLPNVKAYSDYADEKVRANSKLDETDGPTQYMLKTAIPTVMLIFFLTIGFSGTLGKAYGMVVEGMATAADNLVSKNLAAYVNKMIISGEAYQFTLATRGTEDAKMADKIARDVYALILSATDSPNEEYRQLVGKAVEDNVLAQMLGGSSDQFGEISPSNGSTMTNFWPTISGKAQANTRDGRYTAENPLVLDDDKAKGVTYKTYTNIDSTPTVPQGEFTFNLKQIVQRAYESTPSKVELTDVRDQFVHVIVQYNPGSGVSFVSREQGGSPTFTGSEVDVDE
jgi:hypothetical protein